MAVGELSFGALQRSGIRGFSESLAATYADGRSFDDRFSRLVASAGINAFGFLRVPVSASATYGVTNAHAPLFEQISLGGGSPALFDRLLLAQRVAMPALPSGIGTGTSALVYRVALNAQPLGAYFWSGATAPRGTRFSAWHRVIGLEGSQSVASIPVAGVPAARIVYGVGESLDAPLRRQIRGYLNIVINP